jgi:hypothetical protein
MIALQYEEETPQQPYVNAESLPACSLLRPTRRQRKKSMIAARD